MILYTIYQYFSQRCKRWITCTFMLFIFSIFLKYLVLDTFENIEGLTIWDYLFGTLSYPLVIFLLIPILFCYLIADIIVKDFKESYIVFVISRASNRFNYFLSKCITIIIAANLFLLSFLCNLFLVGIIFRFSFYGKFHYDVLKVVSEDGLSIIQILAIQYALIVIGLSCIGILTLTFSIIWNHAIYPILAIMLLIIQANAAYHNNHLQLIWSPIGQLALSVHSPFYFYGIYPGDAKQQMEMFTLSHSFKFLSIMLGIAFIIGTIGISRVNLCRKT